MPIEKSASLLISFAFVLSISITYPITGVNAQSESSANFSSKIASDNASAGVTVSATASIAVSNATLTTKDKMLRNAVIGFLISGPNVLKITPTDEPVVQTKITNKINNTTQSVQGMEATNAIIGVEVSKALHSLISSSGKLNQTAILVVETSSKCKPSQVNLILCENTVTLR